MEFLVSCGLCRKALRVEETSEIEGEIRKVFNMPPNTKIIIQAYSQKWGEYIDTSVSDLKDCDKLNVIRCDDQQLSVNIQASPSDSVFESSSFSTIALERYISEGDESDLPVHVLDSPSYHDSTGQAPSLSEPLVKVGSPAWPSPFKLPWQCFPPDLVVALKDKRQLEPRLQKKLVQAVFDEMRKVTWTPAPYQYDEAARAITAQFPHLSDKAPFCKPHDIWKGRLSDKFRNERKRTKLHGSGSVDSLMAPEKKQKALSSTVSSDNYPNGEDEETMKKHTSALQKENLKEHPDEGYINQLMDITYPVRRKSILAEKTLVFDVKKTYPALFTQRQMLQELNRISDNPIDVSTCINSMQKFVSSILAHRYQSQEDRCLLQKLQDGMAASNSDGEIEYLKTAGAMLLLPAFFIKEGRSQLICHGDQQETSTPEPHISHTEGEVLSKEATFEISAEASILFKVIGPVEAIMCLLASYFVFNMAYPQRIKNTLTFIEYCVLNISRKDEKPPKQVRRVANLLSK